MDGSEAVEVIDLTLDEDEYDYLESTQELDFKDESGDGDTTRENDWNADGDAAHAADNDAAHAADNEEPADDDDIYSLETLPTSISRMDTMPGDQGAVDGRGSRLSRLSPVAEESSQNDAPANIHAG